MNWSPAFICPTFSIFHWSTCLTNTNILLLFDIMYAIVWFHYGFVGPSDDAPKQLAIHFKNVLLEFKNKSWSHFSKDKLGSRKKFDPKELADNDYRTFDRFPEAFWLGEALIRRSLLVVFESIRKLYYSYKTHSLLPKISLHLGDIRWLAIPIHIGQGLCPPCSQTTWP